MILSIHSIEGKFLPPCPPSQLSKVTTQSSHTAEFNVCPHDSFLTLKGVPSLRIFENIHKCFHVVDFKKHGPQTLKEIGKSAMKEMGAPEVHIDTSLNKAVWAKGTRNVPFHIP